MYLDCKNWEEFDHVANGGDEGKVVTDGYGWVALLNKNGGVLSVFNGHNLDAEDFDEVYEEWIKTAYKILQRETYFCPTCGTQLKGK